jgi:2-keto-3-deoxy-6-phosphogluconate aldolase
MTSASTVSRAPDAGVVAIIRLLDMLRQLEVVKAMKGGGMRRTERAFAHSDYETSLL